MNDNEKRWEKAEIKRKLDHNATNMKVATGILAMLATLGITSNAALTLCGFSPSEVMAGSAIVYASVAIGVPGYIRHMKNFLSERKDLKNQMQNLDSPTETEEEGTKGMMM